MDKKERKLSSKDYSTIKSYAINKYINKGTSNGDTFLVECVIEAALEYFKTEGYNVIDGKIVKKREGEKSGTK